MDIRVAGRQDVGDLARLLWAFAAPEERARQDVCAFAADLARWWSDHQESHVALVARADGSDRPDGDDGSAGAGMVVGMAWVALLARVPRPGELARRSADVQSVYVVAEQRGRHIGSALVRAAVEHARLLGVSRVTVHSSPRAVPVYRRLGFSSSRELLHLEVEQTSG